MLYLSLNFFNKWIDVDDNRQDKLGVSNFFFILYGDLYLLYKYSLNYLILMVVKVFNESFLKIIKNFFF